MNEAPDEKTESPPPSKKKFKVWNKIPDSEIEAEFITFEPKYSHYSVQQKVIKIHISVSQAKP